MLLLAVAFTAFATLPVELIKYFGVGLAMAVLVAATFVDVALDVIDGVIRFAIYDETSALNVHLQEMEVAVAISVEFELGIAFELLQAPAETAVQTNLLPRPCRGLHLRHMLRSRRAVKVEALH